MSDIVYAIKHNKMKWNDHTEYLEYKVSLFGYVIT